MARILIASGDVARRGALAGSYLLTGNTVLEVGTAAACLDLMDSDLPEALVLDPRLPGLEDSRLLHSLRRNPSYAGMKISLLAAGMDGALWESIGRQFFDVVVEDAGPPPPAPAGKPPAGGKRAASGESPRTETLGSREPRQVVRRVLVVEDEPTYCILLATEFHALGWVTLGAGSAEDALVLLGSEEVDAVLSDINLPGMEGNELAALLRKQRPDLKIVLMTGMPKDRYPEVPADVPILPKPISVKQLMSAMRFLNQK